MKEAHRLILVTLLAKNYKTFKKATDQKLIIGNSYPIQRNNKTSAVAFNC
jgi:hypothetical protein